MDIEIGSQAHINQLGKIIGSTLITDKPFALFVFDSDECKEVNFVTTVNTTAMAIRLRQLADALDPPVE